jgi:hypothetical protein
VTTRWDDLPADWAVDLAAGRAPHMLLSVLQADVIWRKLTRPQRELLLSACAGWPVKPRTDVKDRLVGRGLVDEQLTPTDAGRFVVKWRLK